VRSSSECGNASLAVCLSGLVFGSAGLVLDPADPDPADGPGGPDVGDRVAVEQHQVCAPARLDDPAVGEPECRGRKLGRRPQQFDGGQAGAGQQFQLAVQALTVRDAARDQGRRVRVGPGQDRDPGLVQRSDAGVRGTPR
jgi:hypothetical protein